MPNFIAEINEGVSLLSKITQFQSRENWIQSQVSWTPRPKPLALAEEVSEEVSTDRHSQRQCGKEFQVLISYL